MPQPTEAQREQLRKDIEQSVREAQKAAEEAAQAATTQGRTVIQVPAPFPAEPAIPPEAESISIAFFMTVAAIIIGWPIMRAIGKRIERGTPAPAVPQEVRDQLQQLNQAVEAIAIEVERISEGQRYTTKLLSEQPREQSRLGGGQS
jgi:small-conductance mechanosensitive channel